MPCYCYDVVLLLLYVVLYIHTLRNHGVMILAGLLYKREKQRHRDSILPREPRSIDDEVECLFSFFTLRCSSCTVTYN